MRIAIIGLLGLVFAAGLGTAAHLIARDTVALPVASIEGGENLAPGGTTRGTETVSQTTTRETRTTTTPVTTSRTTTDDDHGRNRGRGRGGDSSGKGSGSSGSGGGDSDD